MTEPDTPLALRKANPAPAPAGAPRPQHGDPGGDDRGGKDLQQSFVATLLAIVTAYTTTGSVLFTAAAAVMALLVTVFIGRK
ncbi:hypothetical protein [Actinomadura chokoriensis]|uniref:hypothetical protein n=1 Tax=Actinomadura chokoriensis TaxID=454156 RepID=UPI0031F94AD6